MRRYIKYNDIISKFGLGMVIFPCILSNIGGAASVKYIDVFTSDTLNKLSFNSQESSQNGEMFKISFTIPLKHFD